MVLGEMEVLRLLSPKFYIFGEKNPTARNLVGGNCRPCVPHVTTRMQVADVALDCLASISE